MMGLFSSPKVPNTISDRKMAGLRRQAERASKESMFSKRNVEKRLADGKQRGKAGQS